MSVKVSYLNNQYIFSYTEIRRINEKYGKKSENMFGLLMNRARKSALHAMLLTTGYAAIPQESCMTNIRTHVDLYSSGSAKYLVVEQPNASPVIAGKLDRITGNGAAINIQGTAFYQNGDLRVQTTGRFAKTADGFMFAPETEINYRVNKDTKLRMVYDANPANTKFRIATMYQF